MRDTLVNYPSSSESENRSDKRKSSPKSKRWKRFDSDYSYSEEKDSDFFYLSFSGRND